MNYSFGHSHYCIIACRQIFAFHNGNWHDGRIFNFDHFVSIKGNFMLASMRKPPTPEKTVITVLKLSIESCPAGFCVLAALAVTLFWPKGSRLVKPAMKPAGEATLSRRGLKKILNRM